MFERQGPPDMNGAVLGVKNSHVTKLDSIRSD